jgi:hypothetical protein
VAVANPRFSSHVALRIGNAYADVRGILGQEEVHAYINNIGIKEVGRNTLELHAGGSGLEPSYIRVREIAAAR